MTTKISSLFFFPSLTLKQEVQRYRTGRHAWPSDVYLTLRSHFKWHFHQKFHNKVTLTLGYWSCYWEPLVYILPLWKEAIISHFSLCPHLQYEFIHTKHSTNVCWDNAWTNGSRPMLYVTKVSWGQDIRKPSLKDWQQFRFPYICLLWPLSISLSGDVREYRWASIRITVKEFRKSI